MYKLIFLLILLPSVLFAQEKTESKSEKKPEKKSFPIHSVRTELFKLKSMSLNRIVPTGEGEILESEFILENMTDDPIELYIFTIATCEHTYTTKSSFESPSLDDKKRIKLIVPFPYDIENFNYGKGQFGNKEDKYVKFPKNIKSGIDPDTGKPYVLKDKMLFRSRHLTRYLKKFKFFNEFTILIFDKNEKLIYRQLFSLKKVSR